MDHRGRARELHATTFGGAGVLAFRAGGRVNLIGEHVDYHGGSVLPVAIDREVVVVARVASGSRVHRLISDGHGPVVEVDPARLPAPASLGWAAYPVAALEMLRREGTAVPPLELAIASDLPAGAGLSSSAALLVATTFAALRLLDRDPDPVAVASLCHRAETEFVGVPCGIMDPFAVALARPGHALLLDCASRRFEHVPLPAAELALLVIDSGTRHELRDGGYRQRVEESGRALDWFRRSDPALRHLAELDERRWVLGSPGLDQVARRRSRHVVEEVSRTADAVAALRRGELLRLGAALAGSHRSLRDHYDVSTERLDTLFRLASAQVDVYGARLVGAGFGGALLAVLRPEAVDEVRERVAEGFAARYGARPESFPLRVAGPPAEVDAEGGVGP